MHTCQLCLGDWTDLPTCHYLPIYAAVGRTDGEGLEVHTYLGCFPVCIQHYATEHVGGASIVLGLKILL